MGKAFSSQKRLEWKKRILEQRESDLSINKWCLQNQINPDQFYYWQSRLFTKKLSQSSFIELTCEGKKSICIEYHDLRIYLERDFDPFLLKKCLSVLKEIQC